MTTVAIPLIKAASNIGAIQVEIFHSGMRKKRDASAGVKIIRGPARQTGTSEILLLQKTLPRSVSGDLPATGIHRRIIPTRRIVEQDCWDCDDKR